MVSSFTEFVSFFEAGEDMTNEEYGIYMRAIHNFAFNDIEPDYPSLPPLVKAALRTVIASVRKNKEDRKNGEKGGRPKTNTGLNENKNPPLEKTETKENENKKENENLKENEKENVCMTAASTDTASQKHKYGQYKHVLLTDEEVSKLTEKEGADRVDKAITFLDEYIEMKGYKAKSHYLALIKWVFQAVTEQERRQGKRIPDEISGMEVY